MARRDSRNHDDLRQRQTQQVERISELAADSVITDHVAESDPHSQYATDADLTAHESAGDPHPTYLTQAEADALYRSDTLLVRSASDLPAASGGEHLLPQGGTVMFLGTIDLGSNAIRIPATSPPTVRGMGTDAIMSTATGGVLRCTDPGDDLVLREFSIIATAGACLSLSASTTDHQLNMFFVGMIGTSAGTIDGFDVQGVKSCFIDCADGLEFGGTTNKLFIDGCPFYGVTTGNAAIRLAADFAADVADIVTSFFKFDNGTCIEAVAGYTVTEGRLRGSLIDGTATPLSGLTPADTEWNMVQNSGVRDSRVAGEFSLDTAASTTISTISTPVKVSGTTTPSAVNERFTHTDNRLTYTGTLPVLVSVMASALVDSGNNVSLSFFIAKNGTVISTSESVIRVGSGNDERSVTVVSLVELETSDYIEVWAQNNDDTDDLTANSLTLAAAA